jgi:DNA-binding MarR family transcriptional regulator
MNSKTMPEIKQHEYELLNEIAQDSLVTQSNLSDRLGIAVGSVNWYIKRLIHRGWIKVSRLDRTRLKYDLTTDGMAIFTQRALLYARDSLKVYSDFRNKAKSVAVQLKEQNVDHVYLQGNDEIMDILKLTCIESGLTIDTQPGSVIVDLAGQEFRIAFTDRKKG